jgi:CHAT domain-containing protein
MADILRPRMWWCPVGAFAELPLHAAGVYSGSNMDCIANYIVSSYTPTLLALINARRINSDETHRSDVLLISVPNAPNLDRLPNAVREIQTVQQCVPVQNLTILDQEQATIENVLKEASTASVLHLACHGHQSQDDPPSSGFSLNDGRLTLEKLMKLHLPYAQLAYLSACQTAGTDENQPDEAINLASTMLFVGFKSVIATMWYVSQLSVIDFLG